MNYELCLMHHGVKGMKWGVRRYQNKDGSLTPKGIKKYATKGYASDAYNSSSRAGKVWNKITDAHKYDGIYKYHHSNDAQNKARAKKYMSEKKKDDAAKKARNQKIAKKTAKGALVTSKALAAIGSLYVTDKIVNNGRGVKAVKDMGRVAVTLGLAARGDIGMKWVKKY